MILVVQYLKGPETKAGLSNSEMEVYPVEDSKEILKNVLVRQVEYYRELFNEAGRWPKFEAAINYKWDLRGKCAGQAISKDGKYTIRFNLDIASNHFDDYLVTTVPHELAHLILDSLYPWAPSHGQHWKLCMEILGAPANRTHNYSFTPARVVKQYPYMCSCQIHSVSSITHNRVQSGQSRVCTQCRSRLVYAPEIDY